MEDNAAIEALRKLVEHDLKRAIRLFSSKAPNSLKEYGRKNVHLNRELLIWLNGLDMRMNA